MNFSEKGVIELLNYFEFKPVCRRARDDNLGVASGL
jgi:hypothetical protein